MKKLESLGKVLSKDEQIKIKGGGADSPGCGLGGDVCNTSDKPCCTSDRVRKCVDGYCAEPSPL